MNLNELTEKIAVKTGVSKSLARTMIKETISTIQSEVKQGKRVTLVGFGTFERILRQSRKARNPATGDTFKVPQKNLPKFKPGKNFREMISGKAKPKLLTKGAGTSTAKKSKTKKATAKKAVAKKTVAKKPVARKSRAKKAS
jgi:DNA-binding protein HU-beta